MPTAVLSQTVAFMTEERQQIRMRLTRKTKTIVGTRKNSKRKEKIAKEQEKNSKRKS